MLFGSPLLKVSTVDAAVNYIKKEIEEGRLKPGDRLPSERELQQLLGVSRLTLREALAKLSALGIVAIAHGKGSFVAGEMNLTSLGDVFLPLFAGQDIQTTIDFFEARMILEGEAVKLCASRRTATELKRLKEILEKSEAAMNDSGSFGHLDYLFHKEISIISKNVFVQNMMGCLNNYIRDYLLSYAKTPDARTKSHEIHLKIFEYIEAKESENAGRVMRNHLERILNVVKSLAETKTGPITAKDIHNKIT